MNEMRTKSEQHEHDINQGLTWCARLAWCEHGGRGSNVVNDADKVRKVWTRLGTRRERGRDANPTYPVSPRLQSRSPQFSLH
jgi:hypothetical protein